MTKIKRLAHYIFKKQKSSKTINKKQHKELTCHKSQRSVSEWNWIKISWSIVLYSTTEKSPLDNVAAFLYLYYGKYLIIGEMSR